MVSFLRNLGLHGTSAFMVKVGVDLSNELPSFEVVGLPDTTVRESRDRVRTALKNCGFTYSVPKIMVNLAPADKREEGPIYDLPVLAALPYTSDQLEGDAEYCAVVGGLSPSGEVWPVEGILPMALAAKQAGITGFSILAENAPEGAVVEGLWIYPVTDIRSLVIHLTGQHLIPPCASDLFSGRNTVFLLPGLSEMHEQEAVKCALRIAVSGNHNMLSIGPPGSGKSILARYVPSILPGMTSEEAIITTQIYSVADTPPGGSTLMQERPFRALHYTTSPARLSGGGAVVCPEEISLAYNGVPFLDKLSKFHHDTMEILRQPLEDGIVTISWVSGSVTHLDLIMLVATMNPCPCDYFEHPTRTCVCSSSTVDCYLDKISGLLLDRLDLHVEVPPVELDVLSSNDRAENSARIREGVNVAWERQSQRFHDAGITCSAHITPNLLHEVCRLSPGAQTLLKTALKHMGLSARTFDRMLKIPCTTADPDNRDIIELRRAAEAMQYRILDRKYWSVPREPKGNVQVHYQSRARALW